MEMHPCLPQVVPLAPALRLAALRAAKLVSVTNNPAANKMDTAASVFKSLSLGICSPSALIVPRSLSWKLRSFGPTRQAGCVAVRLLNGGCLTLR